MGGSRPPEYDDPLTPKPENGITAANVLASEGPASNGRDRRRVPTARRLAAGTIFVGAVLYAALGDGRPGAEPEIAANPEDASGSSHLLSPSSSTDPSSTAEHRMALEDRAGPHPLATTRLTIQGRSIEVVAGVALVKPVDARTAKASLRAMGSRLLYVSPTGYWRVSTPESMDLERFLERLAADPGFAASQPEGVMRSASLESGEIAHGDLQWNLEQIHWETALGRDIVELAELSAYTVAVIDSGVAYENRTEDGVTFVKSPDLDASDIVYPRDFVDDDSHANDHTGHGTHVANVIAADGGTVGVAPYARIMPLRVLDHENVGQELALVEAVDYAVHNGADVINLSLSFFPGYVPGEALAAAIQDAEDQDVLVVAASGNDGKTEVTYPAAYSSVLAVGASRLVTLGLNWIADYSNTGTALDLVAPGGSTTLDTDWNGFPDAIVAQTMQPGHPSQLGYFFMAGTSQATAHVSGAALWLRAAGADNHEIRQTLINTSTASWGLSSFARRSGWGVLNLDAALQGYAYGQNAVNTQRQYYVNVLPLLLDLGSTVGPLGLIRVIDANGLPARNVIIAGHWFGHSKRSFAAITNLDGMTWVSTCDSANELEPAMFGLQVDRVLDGTSLVAPAPRPFYYLSDGLRAAFSRWSAEPALEDARLIFQVTPGAHGIPSWMASSYVIRPIGPNNGFAPMAITFNPGWVEDLQGLQPSQYTDVTASFPGPAGFGWGSQTSLTLRVVPGVEAQDGSIQTLALMPLDLAMIYRNLAPVVPILNSSSSMFVHDNEAFLNGMNSGATGKSIVPVLLSSGVLSSFGDAGILSSFGDSGILSSFGDGIMNGQLGGNALEVPEMVASSVDDGTDEVLSVSMSLWNPGTDYILATPDQ